MIIIPITIPLIIKKTCCDMYKNGTKAKYIYENYFKQQFSNPQTYGSFYRSLHKWALKKFPDEITLANGTYDGFTAHGATVQVSASGEIVQAWIKQHASELDPEDFINAIKDSVEPYEHVKVSLNNAEDMLEIPLFDMHWGIAFFDYYEPVLKDVLDIIASHSWKRIVIPFGQDFFHNDSVVNGQTTKGTVIEKVDMVRAIKEGQRFIYSIIDAALSSAEEVKILYTPGNHDRSISWMFMQVLLERYGPNVVDDELSFRRVITYGDNAIMLTHGDSRQATPKNLAHIFPIAFPNEFSAATIREVHAGHLHSESDSDVFGVMVRRLASGNKTDEWTDKEDFIGTHKRFMLFRWGLKKLKSIDYI